MPRQSSSSTGEFGDVRAGRDVIMGDQVNQVDLRRVEALLAEIVDLLRQPQPSLRVERDANHSVIIVGGAGNEVCFTPADMCLLGALQRARQDDPRGREEIYLTRFVLGETYARWGRKYLPLAGRLLDAPLRLSDRADQSISSAGQPLEDVRQALTKFNKTRLVILGEPGVGKTTTLHCLALDLSCERLRDPLGGKLPFHSDLFKFDADDQPSDFLRAEWETTGLSETYGQAVAQGQVCFLLDGVNQMSLAHRTRSIKRWAHWAEAELPPGNWAVFTCRTADYLPDLHLPEVRIQSLDTGRMRQYLELRFEAGRAAELWDDLDQRLRAGDDRFERMARNPFMLSLLVDRFEEGEAVTANRAELMDDLARRLIDYELSGYGLQPDPLTADPQRTLEAALAALGRLAFAMQARGEGTGLSRALAAQIPLGDAQELDLSLDQLLGLATDATVLEVVEGDDQDRIYAFYHHLLQEYFAARELLRQFRAGGRLGKYWRVPWRRWQFVPRRLAPGQQLDPPPVTGWEETTVMAAGLAGEDVGRLVAAVRQLNLPLAGRCLAEIGPEREELQDLVKSLRAELLDRQRSPQAHLRARIAAGLALGDVGHPELRPRAFQVGGRTVRAIAPPLQAVPAGEFKRGSDRTDQHAYPDEITAQRRVRLPAFSIGRYPVTNGEYRFFVEDGGYRDERWWDEAGQAWKRGGGQAHAGAIEQWLSFRALLQEQDLDEAARRLGWRPQMLDYWRAVVQLSDEGARERAQQVFERSFDRPAFWDDPELNNPAKPVVGVNWFEATAYCRWLSTVTGREYRLPTEAEWEKAARGGDGRAYPWGDRFDPGRCNSVESHIFTTTPVGLYPAGVSPYGLFDAAGNTWEWTADWYQAYPGGEADASADFGERFRAVRGGSWNDARGRARCGFLLIVGFRVVSPGSVAES
jgi:formylglycine-generating enzyme required for sulfatase activity